MVPIWLPRPPLLPVEFRPILRHFSSNLSNWEQLLCIPVDCLQPSQKAFGFIETNWGHTLELFAHSRRELAWWHCRLPAEVFHTANQLEPLRGPRHKLFPDRPQGSTLAKSHVFYFIGMASESLILRVHMHSECTQIIFRYYSDYAQVLLRYIQTNLRIFPEYSILRLYSNIAQIIHPTYIKQSSNM